MTTASDHAALPQPLPLPSALPLPTPADGTEPAGFAVLLERSATEARYAAPGWPQVAPAATPAQPVSPADAGVTELLAGYAAGSFTPVDVVDELTARIEARGGRTGAVLRLVTQAREAAERSAERWRRGDARPLEGVPFGVKDVLDVAGQVVTAGSRVTGERVAAEDSTVVARWRAAGALPLALLATSEFACGAPRNARYGQVRNPWDVERWTGGSSTGSGAALADRLMPLALGSDTGGSIRIPSAWCGVTGLKPTYGLVPRTGVATLSWSLDHVGPMARSAADLALTLPALAGADGVDPVAADVSAWFGRPVVGPTADVADLRGVAVGVPTGWFVDRCDAAVLARWRAVLDVLEAAGARLVEVAEPTALPGCFDEAWTILLAELGSGHERDAGHLSEHDDGFVERFRRGFTVLARDYLRALRRRPRVLADLLDACFTGVDVLVTPGAGGTAPLLSDLRLDIDGVMLPMQQVHSRNTMPFNLTGLPALMLPSGVTGAGLPTSVQVVARPFREDVCLRVGMAVQARTAHHLAVPPG